MYEYHFDESLYHSWRQWYFALVEDTTQAFQKKMQPQLKNESCYFSSKYL